MILDDAPDSWHLKRLDEYTIIKPFDCGDEVLNNYLLQESKFYLSERLAVTYIIESEEETIAYFCLLNDKVSRNIDAKTWNKINKKIPNAKRKGTYPAVKIGRLAVTKKYAKSGFGEFMLDSVKQMYSENGQISGCRFITVDSYGLVTKFYEKHGFKFMTESDAGKDTRLMYFDLLSI